jgi:DNA-binding GntR family transcriptional regulator
VTWMTPAHPLAEAVTVLAQRAAARPAASQGQHATKLSRSIYSGWVTATLRQAIIEGTLPSDMPLAEARLADHMSVSRGPVRSALRALAGEGLIRTMPNGRSIVIGFDTSDLLDLMTTRYQLESTAIRWGVAQFKFVSPILRAYAAMEAEGSSTFHLVDLDLDFHHALVEFSGSRFLVQSWLAIAPVIHTVIVVANQRLATRDPASDYNQILNQHRPVVNAIVRGEADVATTILRKQFDVTVSMFEAATAVTE